MSIVMDASLLIMNELLLKLMLYQSSVMIMRVVMGLSSLNKFSG